MIYPILWTLLQLVGNAFILALLEPIALRPSLVLCIIAANLMLHGVGMEVVRAGKDAPDE